MDGLVLAFAAAQAILLAVAIGMAWSRGRTLEAIDESLREADRDGGASVDGEDLTDRLRRLRRRADAAEFGLEQRLRDLAYLADLVGVDIVRLTDELRVKIASTATCSSGASPVRCSAEPRSRRSATTAWRRSRGVLARPAGPAAR